MLHPTLEIVGCPGCAAPAEIVDRFVLASTDGPIEHATVLCTARHRFTVVVERLANRPADAAPSAGHQIHPTRSRSSRFPMRSS